ncbi:hypothetical protein [Hominisplanchenecus faecis]|uniref:hypothetical protein n=1 Tax=Hominisplanchenecus faecis TaxID=2885351 RepID=UPI002010BF32|nr:hypothetical protein [Hominisplanchenecus faecis]
MADQKKKWSDSVIRNARSVSGGIYEAMTAKMQIDRLIRVPFREDITTGHYAVIAGQTYKILQVQTIADCRPKSMDISMQKIRQRGR